MRGYGWAESLVGVVASLVRRLVCGVLGSNREHDDSDRQAGSARRLCVADRRGVGERDGELEARVLTVIAMEEIGSGAIFG